MIKVIIDKVHFPKNTSWDEIEPLFESKYLFDLQDIENDDTIWDEEFNFPGEVGSKLLKDIDVVFVQFAYDASNLIEAGLYEILHDMYSWGDITELRYWFHDIAPGEYWLQLAVIDDDTGDATIKLTGCLPITNNN